MLEAQPLKYAPTYTTFQLCWELHMMNYSGYVKFHVANMWHDYGHMAHTRKY